MKGCCNDCSGQGFKIAGKTSGEGFKIAGKQRGNGFKLGGTGLPPALAKWTNHLKSYRMAHPNVSLKVAMQEAKKTYSR